MLKNYLTKIIDRNYASKIIDPKLKICGKKNICRKGKKKGRTPGQTGRWLAMPHHPLYSL
jgi:hypothetical protein